MCMFSTGSRNFTCFSAQDVGTTPVAAWWTLALQRVSGFKFQLFIDVIVQLPLLFTSSCFSSSVRLRPFLLLKFLSLPWCFPPVFCSPSPVSNYLIPLCIFLYIFCLVTRQNAVIWALYVHVVMWFPSLVLEFLINGLEKNICIKLNH